MGDIVVRSAVEADLRAILDIYNEAVLHSTATYDTEPRTWEEQLAWFAAFKPPYCLLAAVDGAGVVGWGCLPPYHQRPGYRFTAEDSVYVHTDHRRRGIGAALLAALVAAGRDAGFHTIMALIDAEGAPSIRLHERFGFRHVGTFAQVGYKFDRWLDVVHLQLMLE